MDNQRYQGYQGERKVKVVESMKFGKMAHSMKRGTFVFLIMNLL